MSTITPERHDHEQREHDPKGSVGPDRRRARRPSPAPTGTANRSVNADPMSMCGNPGAAAAMLRVGLRVQRVGGPDSLVPPVPMVGRGEEGEHRHRRPRRRRRAVRGGWPEDGRSGLAAAVRTGFTVRDSYTFRMPQGPPAATRARRTDHQRRTRLPDGELRGARAGQGRVAAPGRLDLEPDPPDPPRRSSTGQLGPALPVRRRRCGRATSSTWRCSPS